MKKWIAAAATAALLAAPAMAGGGGSKDIETRMMKEANEARSQSGTGGSATEGQKAEEQEISGTVIKLSGNNLIIEHMGAAIALQLGNKTQFEGALKSKKDIKQGEQITVGFTMKNAQNTATKVSGGDESGTGGSGAQQQDEVDVQPGPEQPTY